jgi:hypothetical protein
MPDANRYAAEILRGIEDRISELETTLAEEGVPNILRTAEDTLTTSDTAEVDGSVTASDTVTVTDGSAVTVTDGAEFTWGSSTWGGADGW